MYLLYFTHSVIVVSIIIEQGRIYRDQNKTPVEICKFMGVAMLGTGEEKVET